MKTLKLDNIDITHINHASFKIKTEHLIIYFDPFKVTDQAADYILITHDHYDHFDPESIKRLKKDETIIIGPKILEGKISGVFTAMLPNNIYEDELLKVKAVPAYNKHHPKEKNLLGYVLEVEGKKIYYAGDTDKIPEMGALDEIDLALLPIGGTYTMNEEEAALAVKEFKPKIVVPMHYGEIPGGGNPEKFKELVGDSSKVEILK